MLLIRRGDAPRHKKPFNYAGKPYLTQLPAMPSMCARFEQFKIMFNAALGGLNAMATKRAMSCLGCSDDGGEACDFKNMFGWEPRKRFNHGMEFLSNYCSLPSTIC